jgi:cytochrome c
MCLTMVSLLPSRGLSQEGAEQAFNNACRICHTTKEGDNRLGPSLHNLLGRKAGSLPGYNFSSAMKEAGFVWDEDKLDKFMAQPDKVVPGNNMKPYGGLASTDERTKIIAFLRSKTESRP